MPPKHRVVDKVHLFAAAFALAAFLTLSALPASGQVRPALIILGDSESTGWGIEPPHHWMTIMAGRLDAELENLAQPSVTSRDALDQPITWPSGRTQSQLAEGVALLGETERVAAVVVQFGMGDYFALHDPNNGQFCYTAGTRACDLLLARASFELQQNLSQIVSELQAAAGGAPVVLWTYFPAYFGPVPILHGDCVNGLNGVIRTVAALRGAALADVCPYFPVERSPLLHTDGIHPSIAGHAIIADVLTNALPPDTDGDGLNDLMEELLSTNPALPDTDTDGCTDGVEFGPFARFGGRRSPTNPWDLFDTPPRDGSVATGDLLRVVQRFGTTEGTALDALTAYRPAELTPLDALSSPLSYDPAFDRTPPSGPNADPWDLGPPDGSITAADIFLLILQFGHACR